MLVLKVSTHVIFTEGFVIVGIVLYVVSLVHVWYSWIDILQIVAGLLSKLK